MTQMGATLLQFLVERYLQPPWAAVKVGGVAEVTKPWAATVALVAAVLGSMDIPLAVVQRRAIPAA
jgi:hypothetical protein